MICNLFVGFKTEKTISVPKTKNYYSDKKNFRFSLVSYRTFIEALNFLLKEGYVKEEKGYKDYNESYVTVYWATEKLQDLFIKIQMDMIETKTPSEIVMKDRNKQSIPYKGTAFTKELRLDLKKINTIFADSDFKTTLDGDKTPIHFFPRLSAIYNNDDWKMGGRLYCIPQRGISYQNLSKHLRSRILINDIPTIELDYSGLHLNMIYAKNGIQLGGDPYAFLAAHDRRHAKLAVLVLINASSYQKAFWALTTQVPAIDWKEILQRCQAFHEPISHYFGSGIGIQLQNTDGQMARSIVKYFSTKKVPVLPVHDSFIIEKSHEKELREFMQITYA